MYHIFSSVRHSGCELTHFRKSSIRFNSISVETHIYLTNKQNILMKAIKKGNETAPEKINVQSECLVSPSGSKTQTSPSRHSVWDKWFVYHVYMSMF